MLTRRPHAPTPLRAWLKLAVLATVVAGCAGPVQRDSDLSSARGGGYRGGATVAVLLPHSGRFAGAAQALKDGILAAQAADEQGKRPQLRFYDTSAAQSANALVQKAAADGASFVIGPLQKEAVEELARGAGLPVPVLALNRVSTGRSPANLYQFSLSPEDEAAEAARKAWEGGHRSALMLYPSGPWGERMAKGFHQQWLALGGRLAATEVYDPDGFHFTQPIGNLSARADDADFLFLVATSQLAREIAPRVRAMSAYDFPVFATSHIYGGRFDPVADQPIVGTYFVDIPWLVAPDAGDPLSRERVKQRTPGMQDGLTRLYAMGIDAYRLAPRLAWMASNRGAVVQGKTGKLRLDSQRNIVRGLTLARFSPSGPALASVETRLWAPAKRLNPDGPLLAARGAPRLAAIPR